MQEKTTTHASVESDTDYQSLERLVRERVAEMTRGPLFETDATGLFAAYLAAIPGESNYGECNCGADRTGPSAEAHSPACPRNVRTHTGLRQHYNCSTCKRFIERYGGLVSIDPETGVVLPALWAGHTAEFFDGAVEALRRIVFKVRVTGVFIWSENVWGTPQAGPWTHLSGTPATVYSNALKTANQAMAEKREEYAMLRRGMAKYCRFAVSEAVRVLEADAVDRSEKALGQAKWLLDLHDRVGGLTGRVRDNLVWLAVAQAPPGWCHFATMLGTLLDDVVAGLPFNSIKRRWDTKMHPLQYQRPTTLKEGAVQVANDAVEKLGSAGALTRRFAKLSDVLAFVWRPRPVEAGKPPSGGPFDHLLHRKGGVKAVELPPQRMTWEKFRNEVLPDAAETEFLVPNVGPFFGLVTATNPEAPPLLQWDGLEGHPRNPVSHYFYVNGSPARQWGLPAGAWVKANGIFLKPPFWQEPTKFAHQGGGVFLALDGARDSGHVRGGGFFPECLRSEYHAIRHAMEAYANAAAIQGVAEGDANGIALQKGEPASLRVRAVSGAVQDYLVTVEG